jgi:hypothetical protein
MKLVSFTHNAGAIRGGVLTEDFVLRLLEPGNIISTGAPRVVGLDRTPTTLVAGAREIVNRIEKLETLINGPRAID